jgi:hypothetical protein
MSAAFFIGVLVGLLAGALLTVGIQKLRDLISKA